MYSKIKNHELIICMDISKRALVLDPRFGNDLLQDANILRRHFDVDLAGSSGYETGDNLERPSTAGFFMQNLLHEDSLQGRFEDEVISFLRNTSVGDRRCDPLQWWILN